MGLKKLKEDIVEPSSIYLLANLVGIKRHSYINNMIATHQAVLRLSEICLQLTLSGMKGLDYNTALSAMPEDLLIDQRG